MNFVSGIDGSGTKTGALIMDPVGRVLGAGEGGPSIYGIVPGAVTRASIRNGVEPVRRVAGLPPAPFAAAFSSLIHFMGAKDYEQSRNCIFDSPQSYRCGLHS